MEQSVDLKSLRAPFKPEDIDWRVQRSGVKNSSGWVQAIAYIDNRAVQNRLDDVVGPEKWKNKFKTGPAGGVLAGISIRINDEWVTKWDGAENTNIEAVKGGLSDAMKRASVQWGIGRYLYELESTYCPVRNEGDYYIKIKQDGKPDITGYWSAPALPAWAKPIILDTAPPPSAAALITGTAPAKEAPIDNPPTTKQLITIKNLWREAGADPSKRDEWMKAIKTDLQAAQAIKKLEEKKAQKEDES
jgi:hypothetical protein